VFFGSGREPLCRRFASRARRPRYRMWAGGPPPVGPQTASPNRNRLTRLVKASTDVTRTAAETGSPNKTRSADSRKPRASAISASPRWRAASSSNRACSSRSLICRLVLTRPRIPFSCPLGLGSGWSSIRVRTRLARVWKSDVEAVGPYAGPPLPIEGRVSGAGTASWGRGRQGWPSAPCR
jgi:hypothetical protein